jgi:hypothetical protein
MEEQGEAENSEENFDEDSEAEGMESEMEESDEEMEDELDEEEVPEVIPADTKGINNERRVETESSEGYETVSHEISDINSSDLEESSSEYDSDELDPDSTANPHGFVYGNMLDTFKKSRKDRINDMKDMKGDLDKNEHRDKFKKKKESKRIGKTNKMQVKNKPFMMMKKKKMDIMREKMGGKNFISVKEKNRKRQLGHFRKSTSQRLDAKKMGRK